MTHPSARKGSIFEREVVGFLQGHGFPHIERAYGAGRPADVGDLDGTPGLCWELKNCSRLELAAWVDEAQTERRHARARFGIVVAKRRRKPVADAYALMPLAQLAQILIEAGYGVAASESEGAA